jgi:conjugative relaxase-like TrwC/TraI family protein
MITIRSMASASGYRCYLEKESPGEWVGRGAEILGLPQQVTSEEFSAVRRGLDPATEEPLLPIRNVDRVYVKRDKEGNRFQQRYKAREMHDLTVSAPKSVSVQNIVDPRMMEAHALAVDNLRYEMERICGPMVIAAYRHANSRQLDPNVHTHLVAANLAYTENGWRALDANQIYRNQHILTDHYRERLGMMLQSWGYQAVEGELLHIRSEVCERFSQRRSEIEVAIQRHMKEHEMTRCPTKKEIAIIAREHRQKKDLSLSPEEIRAYQLSRLTPAERDNLIRVRDEALARSEKLKLKVHDEPHFEVGLKRHAWHYGTGPRVRMGM